MSDEPPGGSDEPTGEILMAADISVKTALLASGPEMAVCYRHPGRETGVSCSNCGRPICPDCMTATPVGMRCPECSRQKTPVRTMRNIYAQPTVTYILIGICVLMYLGTVLTGGDTSQVYIDLGTLGSGQPFDGQRSRTSASPTGSTGGS